MKAFPNSQSFQSATLQFGILVACLLGHRAISQTVIIADDYDVPGNGTGFALNTGVNSGINPPATRLTGSAAANLRYIQTATARAAANYSISGNKLQVAAGANSGRFTLSADGTSPYDFAAALGTLGATAAGPAVYEISMKLANNAAGIQRFSFALATEENSAGFWDFGVQLYRAVSTDDFYTIQKRIDLGSSGVADLNAPITTTAPGTYGSEISILIRVTDAGTEAAAFSSRLQVSLDSGTNWVYDTSTDTDLPSGWRLDGPGRFFSWDQAAQAAASHEDFSVVQISAPPPPATRVWTGAGGDDNWSTGGNWGGTAPSGTEPLLFGLASRQVNFNDIASLTTPTLTFTNGGFVLNGGSLGVNSVVSNLVGNNVINLPLDWPTTGGKRWQISAGTELVLGGANAVNVTGDYTLAGGGTLRITGALDINQNPVFILNEGGLVLDGGAFSSLGGFRIGSQAGTAPVQTVVSNGGSLTLEVPGANLRVGDAANVLGQLIVHNGSVSLLGGALGIPYAAGATGEVSQVGGLVKDCYLSFSDNGAGVGVYGVTNGTLEPFQIRKDTAGGTAVIRFQNAVLRPALGADGNAFMTGLDVAEIQAGGLAIDANINLNIGQGLSGAGGLTKSNFASATLTGTNSYAGPTQVLEGKLSLPTVQTNAALIQVANGAELGVNRPARGTTLTAGSLTLGSSTLSFDLGAYGTPTVPMMSVTTLTASGGASSVTINISGGLGLSMGQFPLVDYSGPLGGGFASFTLGSLPSGVSATLVNNTANSSIDLNITAAPGYRWTGASNGDWDFGSVNWVDESTESPSAYADGFVATFRDGASRGDANLTAFLSPAAVVVSNAVLPYVWSGGGAITTPFLRKTGSGSLTRVDGAADLVSEIELNEGSYISLNNVDASLGSQLTDTTAGTGTFVKQGDAILTVSSANSTYDGAILVSGGTLQIANNTSLGASTGATTITNAATLDLNNINAVGEPVVVSGAGVGGQGAIIDSTAATGVQTALTDVTMAGNTAFGAPNGGRWDIRVRASTGPGPGLRGNGFNLTKVGSGFVSIAAQRNLGVDTPYWEMNLGDVLVAEGTLAFAESVNLGNPAAALTINPGAALQLFDMGPTNPISRSITLTDARLNLQGTEGTNVLMGNLQLSGTNTIEINQAISYVEGAITGSGTLTVQLAGSPATGTLILNGASTYSGDVTFSSGTLGGSGSLAGNLTMTGGTLSPGSSLGTFTVNGNVSLGGSTLLEIDRSRTPNSDRLVVGGTLTFGGALTVVIPAGAAAPQAGDVFQLFNKGGGGSFAPIALPDLSGLPGGLSWDTSALLTQGRISVIGSGTEPVITAPYISNGNLILTGSNGQAGGPYSILTSTNVAAPLAAWTTNTAGVFGGDGSFSNAIPVNVNEPRRFFLIKQP